MAQKAKKNLSEIDFIRTSGGLYKLYLYVGANLWNELDSKL